VAEAQERHAAQTPTPERVPATDEEWHARLTPEQYEVLRN